ncbi:MAG: twin transmembrane helix small protein [Gammaproteobacteria bacterium]
MIKLLIAFAFIAIVASLGSALYHLVRYKDHSEQTAKALTLRIGISLALFIFLFLAFAFGWIKPHGIAANMQAQITAHSAPKHSKTEQPQQNAQ